MNLSMSIQSGVLVIISLSRVKKLFLGMRFWICLSLFLLSAIPIVACAVMILNTYEERIVNLRLEQVQNQSNILGNELGIAGYSEGRKTKTMEEAIERLASIYNGRVIVVNAGLRVLKDTYRINDSKILISEKAVLGIKGKASTVYDSDIGYIEITIPIKNAKNEDITGVMVVEIPTDDLNREFMTVRHNARVLVLVCLVITLLLGFVLSGVLLQPVKRLGKAFGKVSKGYMDTAIPSEGFTETREISENYNNLLVQLRQLEESRQEFVSNVSHELKTPITSVKVLTDSLLSQQEAPVEIYREFLKDISDEIDRESKIISDLLSMVRLDGVNSDLTVEMFNINELVAAILRRLRPLAQPQNIEILFEEIRLVLAEVDEVKMSLAITNIVENAIKYNRENGWIKVTLDADQTNFSICVADSGIGIPHGEQEKIFERFYRIDKARSRSTGGTGLGLPITKKIVLMHGGTIDIMSSEEGTSFIITVPLTHAGGLLSEAEASEQLDL